MQTEGPEAFDSPQTRATRKLYGDGNSQGCLIRVDWLNAACGVTRLLGGASVGRPRDIANLVLTRQKRTTAIGRLCSPI